MTENIDYSIRLIHGLFHWQGQGQYAAYKSRAGFRLRSSAGFDAQSRLADLELPDIE